LIKKGNAEKIKAFINTNPQRHHDFMKLLSSFYGGIKTKEQFLTGSG
jgi:hypothetical protein